MTPPIDRTLYEQLVTERIDPAELAEHEGIAARARDLLAAAYIPASVVEAIHDREDALMDLARMREEAAVAVAYELGRASASATDEEDEAIAVQAVAAVMASVDPTRARRALVAALLTVEAPQEE